VTQAPARRRRSAVVLTILGLLLLLAAVVGIGYPMWWQHRSNSVGSELLKEPLVHEQARPSTPHSHPACLAALPAPSSTSMHLVGILDIPTLQLRAPVLQGLDDPVLNVAVGHDPSSPWPGGLGESIVEAHDVSYFSRIDQMHPGQLVTWRDGCHDNVFRVTGSEIVTPGTFLKTPPEGKGLALITCYPTNALFWTPDRYVVETEFVSSGSASSKPTVVQVIPHLKVPAPPDLVAQGLTLQQNPILLGKLTVVGSPSPGFNQGPAPLDVEADALESFFGAEKAIAQQNLTWWSDLAVPGLAMPPMWSDATPYYVTIDVAGTTVRSVILHSDNTTVTLVVDNGTLLIQSVAGA
jgi:sortase A